MAESKGDPHEYLNYMIVERGADKGEVFDYLQKFPLPTIVKDSVPYYEYRNTKKVLEPLRNYYGKAIHINSGYRCRALNELVHGVPHSQHLTGEAADLYLPSVDTGRDWQRWIQQHCPHYDQVILERNRTGRWWLHVSARRQQHMNRHQAFMVVR